MFGGKKKSCTFALAFGKQHGDPRKQRRSLTTFHTDKAVQHVFIVLMKLWSIESKELYIETVNRLFFWRYDSFFINRFWAAIIKQTICTFGTYTYKIYNEEFDPGSGWTLATGLTHASRGVFWGLLKKTTGARVSNAYPTCHSYWDSLSKERLIPNNILSLHENSMKAEAMNDGDAFH